MSELLELADRVESATGPDRELDALIWCALRGVKHKGHNPAWSEEAQTQVEYTKPPKRTSCVSDGRRIPHALPVTASLDAAMTLVPTPGKWSLTSRNSTGFEAWCWLADVPPNWHPGATPALALCAAALRARAAQTPEEVE